MLVMTGISASKQLILLLPQPIGHTIRRQLNISIGQRLIARNPVSVSQ